MFRRTQLVPVAVAVVAVAALALIVVVLVRSHGSGSRSGSAGSSRSSDGSGTTSRSAGRASPGGPPVLTLAYPTDGTRVPRSFVARGRAENLGSGTVWVLAQDGGFTVDRPADLANGVWTASGRKFLPAGSTATRLDLILVLADARCSAKLTAGSKTGFIARLPAGCKPVDTAAVRVTAR